MCGPYPIGEKWYSSSTDFDLRKKNTIIKPPNFFSASTLIKKIIKLSSYIRKFRMEQLQFAKSYMTNGLLNPHIWGNICTFPHVLGSPSSYMTLQLLHFEFPYIWGKFDFLFYHCKLQVINQTPSKHNYAVGPFHKALYTVGQAWHGPVF